MVANTFFNELMRYPLSLHKVQIDPLSKLVEAADFGHKNFEL